MRKRVTTRLLNKCLEEGDARLLSRYLLYKNQFVSSCYKGKKGRTDYSRISSIVGLSRSTVVRDITDMLMRGWCYKVKGNLMFLSPERITKKEAPLEKKQDKKHRDHTNISVYIGGEDASGIEDNLYATRIDMKLRQCIFRAKKRVTTDVYKNPKLKRYIEYCFTRRVVKNPLPLSMRTISEMFGKKNVSYILRRLESKGLLSVKRHDLKLFGPCYMDPELSENTFVHAGKLFQKKSNEYLVNDALYDGCPVRL